MFQWNKIWDCPIETLVAAHARSQQLANDEALFLKTRNAQLVNEVKWLHSELSAFDAHSGVELWRAKALLEAEREETSRSSQLLNMEVKKINLKATEVAGLKAKLEESNIEKEDILRKCNALKTKCIDLDADNERIVHELKAKEAKIKQLSQQLERKPIQPQENRWGAGAWLIPLTAVIVAAGTIVYVTR